MKKIIMVACFVAGCSYGMDCPKDADLASSSSIMSDVQNLKRSDSPGFDIQDLENFGRTDLGAQDIKNLDRSVRIDIANPDLIGQWQDVSDAICNEETDDNIFETSASTYKEGRFWTVVRKVFQPLQITASASTMVLITASEAIKNTNPSVSTGLSYGALGSAVTSGVLSLFIAKMSNRINKLNKIYKAKLAAEGQEVDIEDV